MNPWDIAAWAAAVLALTAFNVRSIVTRRGLLGACGVLLVVYGIGARAWPILALGLVVAVCHGLALREELQRKPEKAPLTAAVPIDWDEPFLVDFIAANLELIRQSQPSFDPAEPREFVRLVTRKGLPAGVTAGNPLGTELHIELDYVTPRYRDSRSASWLFGPGKSTFTDAGFTRLISSAETYEHQTYLEHQGFRHEGSMHVLDL